MGWLVSFAVGAVAGLASSAVFLYLFAPASDASGPSTRGASIDEDYRSRLDQALEEGRRAAAEREAALRAELAAAKKQTKALPPSAA